MSKTTMRMATRVTLVAMIMLLVFSASIFAQGQRYKSPQAWSFGVHGDTQWTLEMAQDSNNPNPYGVAVSTAKQVAQQMINNNVKFVLQTGDLTDYSGPLGFATRAAAAQPLYDAGIGFFPLRGNHETYGYFYQWGDWLNTNIPDFTAAFPQTRGISNTFGATNFSSPSSVITTGVSALDGISYSFDYGTPDNNARFVIVDTEQTAIKGQAAPKNVTINNVSVINPDSTITVKNITIDQGYFYLGWTIYRYSAPISGRVGQWNPASGFPKSDYRGWVSVAGTIPSNKWFRIDSAGRPSANFYGWEEVGGAYPLYAQDPAYPDDPTKTIDSFTFIATDTFNGTGTEFFPGKQQAWISAKLDKSARGTEHAFVFSHRPMINGNHTDSFFGASSAVTPDDQNAFYASLASNDVKYMISGHDHLYNRALDKSPDGSSEVMQIISQGISTKFYTPTRLDDFGKDGVAPNQTYVKQREKQLSQEVLNFGYYIYTVDGPRVSVDYYSTIFPAGIPSFDDSAYPYGVANSGTYPLGVTPKLEFVKKENFGYSLNGQKFEISQGGSYTVVQDSFGATTAKILDGNNNSTKTDLTPVAFADLNNPQTPNNPNDDTQVSGPRSFIKFVNTGWVANPTSKTFKSDILSLWGMSELSEILKTDTYALSMTFDLAKMAPIGCGGISIASLDKSGKWVNAVDLNFGGTKKFVLGPYKAGYGLGTFGVDPKTKTAWAVVNYNADFAITNGIVLVKDKLQNAIAVLLEQLALYFMMR
jgi:hypothetical protein